MDSLEPKIENFLTNIIKIRDWKTVKDNPFHSKRLEILRKIVKSFVNTAYFQNVSMSAEEIDKRHGPSLDEIIEVGSKGIGGVCIHQNYFLYLVLKYLGYDCFPIAANVLASNRDNHICIIVRFPENELFFVDVACGAPCEEVIPLNQLPYRVTAAGYPFEYRRTEEGIYQRVHMKGSYIKGDFPDAKTDDIRYTFTLEPVTLSTFDSSMHEIFTDSENSIFLRVAFLFRHFVDGDAAEATDYNFILILGTTIVIATRENRNVTHYDSYEEIIPVINKYFPKLNPSELEKAIKVWQQYSNDKPDR